MIDIAPGILLISDPFLKDPNFARSVVLICDHQQEGSCGFVLNKLYDRSLKDMLTDFEDINFPLFYGGPVQPQTIHFIHKRPDLIEGGLEVLDNIYWGGEFELVVDLIKTKKISKNDIRFFIGYSGWGEGQLADELQTKSWITRQATTALVFNSKTENIWKDALKDLGGEYSQMVNYPIDPQLN
ncbi:MAG TPA: YqgE/AlgH family protein [Chitinophagaceae bacterium]|nr:YqgE/AlgH family protein [Chitinophagaceae bacterium]MCC6633927.1 YqgE/AlgH family protein [Chitinophagaceae bacterium]HNE92708.1 YqgE/AlgH family protein [Chitinophagaceae bacterium]HNF30569.1 YqgE/AlgH family protein [Chitinophagaceae bacterium]HNM34003.1 YqgE/AlgH family protein [Chitinophagaceae bacterium]